MFKNKKTLVIFAAITGSFILNWLWVPALSSIDDNYLTTSTSGSKTTTTAINVQGVDNDSATSSEQALLDSSWKMLNHSSSSSSGSWVVIGGGVLMAAVWWLWLQRKRRASKTTSNTNKRHVVPPGKRASKLPLEERMALAIQGPTLVFDGVCHLCNGSMKWFSERCRQDQQVWYMWCQHNDAQSLLSEFGISREDLLRSWAFMEDGVVYRGSTAWLRAVRNLKRPWCWLSYFEFIIPLSIREMVYGYIAKNRYKAFGKSEACERPSKFMMARMLHSLQVQQEGEGEQDKQKPLVIPKAARKRLLVVGCGPAGMMVAKKARSAYDVLVVEPKDYFEFTPGILRGMCDPDELKKLHCPLRPVLVEQMGISLIHGFVTQLDSRRATIKWQTKPEHQEDIDKLNRFLVTDVNAGIDYPEIQEIEFDYCVIASGSAYQTSLLWKVFPSPSTTTRSMTKSDQTLTGPDSDSKNQTSDNPASPFSLYSRIAQLTGEHEKLAELNASVGGVAGGEASSTKHQIAILGAGLVGVELAAELCIYYPNIPITIYDLAPTILPSFPIRAREYATQWLTEKGVTIVTNATMEEIEKAKESFTVVYSCVGVTSTAASFMPASTIGERGEIAVNAAMQVVHIGDKMETGLAEKDGDQDSLTAPTTTRTLFGSGRIFAVGDCVRVQGLPPFTKDTYPAEAMAGIVVRNLIHSLNAHCTQNHHAESHLYRIHPLMQITLCSLGPHDCMLILNGMYLVNGKLAKFVKETIQHTKMSEARNEILGTVLWSVIPHM